MGREMPAALATPSIDSAWKPRASACTMATSKIWSRRSEPLIRLRVAARGTLVSAAGLIGSNARLQ